ncbi:MAG TPA: alpha-amylase family protein, partial [Flavitalea sp.]|nr:alpha-amylase family protein [Flavitalea sp.]
MKNISHHSRRQFIKQSAIAGSMIASFDPASGMFAEISKTNNVAGLPWFRTVTRWGQVNITEKDPQQYDIGWWRQYWKRTETKGVIINAGGIVAYYPTNVPFHKQAEYLKGTDLFGDLCRAAHEDGLVVFARMDSNRAHQEFYDQYPGWFAVDKNGKPYKAGELYLSCVNSPYYDRHIPSILTEIANLYKPEGFTDNSWSGLTRDSICYCNYCQKSFREKTGMEIPPEKNWNNKAYRQWIMWNYGRRLEIWDLNNKTTKQAGGPNCIWSGMNSGSISGQSNYFRDYKEICGRADIIMLDDQARRNEGGFQHNAQMGNMIHGMLGWNKLIPESMAMYQSGGGANFRLASKVQPEARMWMINGIAGGIQPWWHHVSAYHEDRRMYHTAEPVMKWHTQNEQYLINRMPVANTGVVWSQQNMDFYGRDNGGDIVEMPWRGMTSALMRAHIPYLPVHADHLQRDAHNFKVLILPNLASMSDEQVNAVKRFAEGGGSVIATGETSLYDEWGDHRNDYALADIFGAHYVKDDNVKPPAEKLAGNVYHTYLRLLPELRAQVEGPKNGREPAVTGVRHKILEGFEETDIIPFGGWLKNIRTDNGTEMPLTYIPQFPVYPPETAWMREPFTNIPGIVIRSTSAGGKIIFVPADIDRQYAINNHPDHANLIKNIVAWVTGDEMLLSVKGTGLIDVHLYEQGDRLVMHVVNITSAATWRQPLEELIAVGPFDFKIRLPKKIHGKKVELKVSNEKV